MESFFVKREINRQISSTLKCTICTSVLISPIQTHCGCRFCQKCIDDHICSKDLNCPNCKLTISKELFLFDKAVEKEIFNLQIKCVFHECNHQSSFRKMINHLNICEFRQEECDKCQELFLYSEIEEHLNNVCKKKVLQCDNCGLDVIREDLEKIHKNVENGLDTLCPQLKSKCPYGCGNDIYDNIKFHLEKCSRKPVRCPFFGLGCAVLVVPDEMDKHLQTHAFQHANFLMSEVNRLRKENENLKELITQTNKSTTKEIQILKEKNAELMSIENFQEEWKKMCKIIENIKIDINKNGQMVSDPTILKDNSIQVVEGECTWIIKDIREKCYEAKSGGEMQLISEPFYLKIPGYRMQLKMYPNGDGKGKDKYLSIYFVIIKGDYDDEISWPFKERIGLSIVSNTNIMPDFAISMKPDKNEFCYGKPKNATNIGAGEPEFISLSNILDNNHYLHNGSLIVKLKIMNLRTFSNRHSVTSRLI